MACSPLTEADRALAGSLADFYKRHLFDDVLPCWETRTADTEQGGYLHCFDRRWTLTGDDKYIWFQGRQTWMFSRLYRETGDRKWLELARVGRDFLTTGSRAYAGGGRFNYQLDRTGRIVKRGTISIHTDFFVLQALAEYALASGDGTDLPLIRQMWNVWTKNVLDPECRDIFHSVYDPRFVLHGIYMGGVNEGLVLHGVIGDEALDFGRLCAEKVLYFFARDDDRAVFEYLGRDGRVIPEGEGTSANPGHTAESLWFVMDLAGLMGDGRMMTRAAEVLDWDWEKGFDHERGGVYSYLNALGGEPYQAAWHKETGARWDDKVWWANCEALVALSMAAWRTDSSEWFARFLQQHEFTQKYFADHIYGEWFSALNADNTVKDSAKGSLWKAAYHLPRALLMTYKNLVSISAGT